MVAVVDSGINPYHADFRDAARTQHPSAYLRGYPASAARLDLTLDAPSYDAAVAADRPRFEAVRERDLRWIPGTIIVGAYVHDAEGTPLLDDEGHGTASASLAVGREHGACERCLLVVVEGFDGLAWAANQSWIDVVSNSWGPFANLGVPARGWGFENDWTMRGAERGQTILFAAGNGVENGYLTPESTWSANTNGPDWVVNVGAWAHAQGGGTRAVATTGKPVDVLGPGWNVPAAAPDSLTASVSFSGTSAATPYVAGAMADALARVRGAIGDPHVGSARVGNAWRLADGERSGGALADGRLSRAELWDAFYRVAEPTRSRGVALYPASVPSTGTWLDAMNEGYGAVGPETSAAAADVLLGRRAPPDRSDVEGWMAIDGWTRDMLWGAWDRTGEGVRDRSVTPPILP